MKRIRLRTIAIFGLAATTGALLLHTSQNVQVDEDKLATLKNSIAQEKNSIRILNAEWAFLNNPERIEKLSRQYLDLAPPTASGMISDASDIPEPRADEPETNDFVAAKEPERPKPAPAKIQQAAFKPSPKPASQDFPPQPQPSHQSPKTKPAHKDFNSLIKNLNKGGKP